MELFSPSAKYYLVTLIYLFALHYVVQKAMERHMLGITRQNRKDLEHRITELVRRDLGDLLIQPPASVEDPIPFQINYCPISF